MTLRRAFICVSLELCTICLAATVIASASDDMPSNLELTDGSTRCMLNTQPDGKFNTVAIVDYKDGGHWKKLISVRDARWQGEEDCARFMKKFDRARARVIKNKKVREK